MSDGFRTRDLLDHNQVLYQLSYAHHLRGNLVVTLLPAILACPPERFSGGYPRWRSCTSAAAALAWSLVGPGWGTKAALR